MLSLIDWPALFFNALWICGAVIALAVLSISQWQSRVAGLRTGSPRMRESLGRPAAQHALGAAAVLFCLGMLGTSSVLLEQVLWGALAAAFAVQGLLAHRRTVVKSKADDKVPG